MITRISIVILYLYSIHTRNWKQRGLYFPSSPGLDAHFNDSESFSVSDFFIAFIKKLVLREDVLPDNVAASSKIELFENMDFTESDSNLGGDIEISGMDMSREGTIKFYVVLS